MNGSTIAALVAIAVGAAISLQSSFSGFIGRRVGIVASAFLVHLTGLFLAGLLLLVFRNANASSWRAMPWHAVVAGFLGVGIVAGVSYTVPRLGLAPALTLTIVAQLFLGAFLDHIGWLGATPRPLDPLRIVGMLVLLVGTWLVVR